MDLRGLRCFYAAAEELHFGRAAERLLISQPSLSQQIRQLERQIGVKLFERSTRRVELTVAGIALKHRVKELLLKTDAAIVAAQHAAGGRVDQLSIAAILPATYRFLPMVLRRFRARFPDTRLLVEPQYAKQMMIALEQGEYDLGIMRAPRTRGSLRFAPLLRDRLVAVIPKDHPFASRSDLALKDFVGEPVVALKNTDIAPLEELNRRLQDAGITLRDDMIISNTMGAIALSSSGAAITFLPEWVSDLVTHDIVTRRIEDLDIHMELGIGWRADNPAAGIEPFIEMARMSAKALGRDWPAG